MTMWIEVTGEVSAALRKYGISKQHQPNPIVQMGLFIDAQGIPLSMCINPGNQNEQLCAIHREKDDKILQKQKAYILCRCPSWIDTHQKIQLLRKQGLHRHPVHKKKLSKPLQEAVFNDDGYRLLSNNMPKTLKEMHEFDRMDESNKALYNDVVYKGHSCR